MPKILFYPGGAVESVKKSHRVADLLERGTLDITDDPASADILVVEDPEQYNEAYRRDETRHWVVVNGGRFPAGPSTYTGTVPQVEAYIGRLFPVSPPVQAQA